MQTHNCFNTDEKVKSYNKNSSLQYNWAKSFIEEHIELIKNAKIIADIGCGDGKITVNLLLGNNPEAIIVGYDYSQEMINFAQSNYPDMTFIQKSVLDLECDNEYDMIFSCCCLHWLDDQTPALIKIKDSLVENGFVLLLLPGYNHTGLTNLSNEIIKQDKWKSLFENFTCPRSYYTATEYEGLLDIAGLKSIEVKESPSENIYENVSKLCDWIRPISPFYSYLSNDNDELKEEFLNDLVLEILKHNKQNEDGSIVLQSCKLEVIAQKVLHNKKIYL